MTQSFSFSPNVIDVVSFPTPITLNFQWNSPDLVGISHQLYQIPDFSSSSNNIILLGFPTSIQATMQPQQLSFLVSLPSQTSAFLYQGLQGVVLRIGVFVLDPYTSSSLSEILSLTFNFPLTEVVVANSSFPSPSPSGPPCSCCSKMHWCKQNSCRSLLNRQPTSNWGAAAVATSGILLIILLIVFLCYWKSSSC